MAFTSEGGFINIGFSTDIINSSVNQWTAFRILEGSNQIWTSLEDSGDWTEQLWTTNGQTKRKTGTAVDVPGSGATTYYLQASCNNDASTCKALNRSLYVRESKGK